MAQFIELQTRGNYESLPHPHEHEPPVGRLKGTWTFSPNLSVEGGKKFTTTGSGRFCLHSRSRVRPLSNRAFYDPFSEVEKDTIVDNGL